MPEITFTTTVVMPEALEVPEAIRKLAEQQLAAMLDRALVEAITAGMALAHVTPQGTLELVPRRALYGPIINLDAIVP